MLLLTNGDSFTAGVELEDTSLAWPYLVAQELGYTVDNLALPGASNDYIIRTTVEYLDSTHPNLCIIAWTTPDRIELSHKHCTPNTSPDIFRTWDSNWARSKYSAQIKLLDRYVRVPKVFCTTWDEPIATDCYAGRLVEWAYGAPQGPNGHPLEQGHKQIAENIVRYIKDRQLTL